MSCIVTRKNAIELGLPRYFTGLSCCHGHISERYTRDKDCVACKADRNTRDRIKNKKPRKIISDEEKRKKKAATKKEWIKNNMERYRLTRQRCRDRNKIANANRARKWQKDNPEAYRAIKQNRRARLKLAEGTHTKYDIKNIFSLQKGKCAYCRVSIKNGYHVDHIQPLALGGSNKASNIQLTCATCNVKKGAKDPIIFAQQIGRLV